MNIDKNELSSANKDLCKQCKTFFASQANKGFCSVCYKKVQKEETDKKESQTIASQSPKKLEQQGEKIEEFVLQVEQKDRKRCFNCNRKVGLLGIECRCGFVYCNKHRLPEDHECHFDHKEAAKKKLEKEIIKVYNGKVNEI